MISTSRIALLIGLAFLAILIMFWLPPILQDPGYHHFADSRTILGVPNFWNVISNAPFFFVALWGFGALGSEGAFAENWERHAYFILLAGLTLVAFGSGYYHVHPSDSTLFWDRLPMTIVFMTLLAITVGERISSRVGRVLLLPFLAIGVMSLLAWKLTGDLRAYGLVQFYPMLALPLMLILFPGRYSAVTGIWAMIAFYALAKLLEFADHLLWNAAAPISGHPWKHIAGAIAMLCYVQTIRHRKLAHQTYPISSRLFNGCEPPNPLAQLHSSDKNGQHIRISLATPGKGCPKTARLVPFCSSANGTRSARRSGFWIIEIYRLIGRGFHLKKSVPTI